MSYCMMTISAVTVLVFCGCNSNNAQQSSSNSAEKPDAAVLAEQLRAIVTKDELMKLEFVTDRASDNGGLRVQRQVSVATPVWIELVSHGDNARAPILSLLEDSDESVRLCTAALLSKIVVSDGLKPIENDNLKSLVIPLLEHSLESTDQHLRYCGVCGLGDLCRWSDELLDRLGESVPKIHKMQHDENAEVRAVALLAYRQILNRLAERSKDPSIRQASSDELSKLEGASW